MDFHLKQWRNQHESEEEEQQQQQHNNPSGNKIPKLLLHPSADDDELHNHPSPADAAALPLFADSTSTTRFPSTRMGSYFSLAQWQELELQALIYRYMLAGASVPPELLHPIKKSLLLPSSASPSYFLHHYSYQPSSLMQAGYFGRGAMDPEPGRCRRTDGKKWRCSRDVVVGHKYCERHVHRGRNRSRKPVEITTAAAAAGGAGGGVAPFNSVSIAGNGAGAGFPRSAGQGAAASIDLFHSNQRTETYLQSEATNNRSDGHVLRHFFDDWPRDSDDGTNSNSTTYLSISTPSASDVSLKLSTGNDGAEEEAGGGPRGGGSDRAQAQMNWAAGWAANQVASMGGPLAEALRSSSASNPFPASVLHQVPRGGTAAETNYVSA